MKKRPGKAHLKKEKGPSIEKFLLGHGRIFHFLRNGTGLKINLAHAWLLSLKRTETQIWKKINWIKCI